MTHKVTESKIDAGHAEGTESAVLPGGTRPVPNRPAPGTLDPRVVEALKAEPRATEPLARDLGRRPADVRAACRRLEAQGLIFRDGRCWRVAPAARCTGW